MCTRYFIDPHDELLIQYGDMALRSRLLRAMHAQIPKAVELDGVIKPDDMPPVIARSRNGSRNCFPMIWGLHIQQRPLLANIRAETAAEKPIFAVMWNTHRCVVPASWYYEWEHFTRPNGKEEVGERYLIQPKGEHYTWLAGLYRMEEGFPHFAILTKPATEELAFLHERMPVMLREADIDEWINPEGKPEEILGRAVTGVLMEKHPASMDPPPPSPVERYNRTSAARLYM